MIALFYVGDFLPRVRDDAAALMAEAHWPGQPGVVQLMHLGIANTASEVADRDLVRTRIRDVDFLDQQRSARLLPGWRGLALHERLLREIKPSPYLSRQYRAAGGR